MNKKLKIYCTAFAIALILVINGSVFHHWSRSWSPEPDNKMEFAELPSEFEIRTTHGEGETISHSTTMVSYELNVKPWSRPDHKHLLSTAAGQTYQVDMEKVKISLPASRLNSNYPIAFIIATVVVSITVFVCILWMVVKLLVMIRKGEVFVTKVSRYLEITGFLLSFLYLFQWAVSYFFTQYMINHIHLADHSIVFKNECNSMYILTGLALMIISQIILMGKDLKEDQELTI